MLNLPRSIEDLYGPFKAMPLVGNSDAVIVYSNYAKDAPEAERYRGIAVSKEGERLCNDNPEFFEDLLCGRTSGERIGDAEDDHSRIYKTKVGGKSYVVKNNSGSYRSESIMSFGRLAELDLELRKNGCDGIRAMNGYAAANLPRIGGLPGVDLLLCEDLTGYRQWSSLSDSDPDGEGERIFAFEDMNQSCLFNGYFNADKQNVMLSKDGAGKYEFVLIDQ
jgi:hypothetical protein